MRRRELKLLKNNAIQVDPEGMAAAIIWHRGIHPDHLTSVSMAAHLRYSRELFFYLLYVYSQWTVEQMAAKYRVNGVAIATYIRSATVRVAKREDYFITFQDHILSLFNNNDND